VIPIKKAVIFLLCALIISMFSGCWSRIEPKYLAIVNSIIYDLDDEGNYKVYTEFLNPGKTGGSEEGEKKSSNFTADSTGASPREAISNISQTVERSLFGGHNKVRFFSEKLAKSDVAFTIDYILRSRLTDETSLVAVIKGDEPEKIYEATVGLSDTVGNYIENMSRFQPDSSSKSVFPTTLDFVRDFHSDGKQPVAGLAQVVESKSKASEGGESGGGEGQKKEYKIIYEGLAAFKDGVLAGYFDGDETRAYNFITNNIHSVHLTVPSENGDTVFNISKSKCGIKTSKEGDKIKLDVKLKIKSRIVSESDTIDISKAETLKMLEGLFNEQVKNEISAVIARAQQEFKSDIFGFGEFMHDQNPKEWKELKKDWDEAFSKAEVSVSVESSIIRSGEIKRPFRYEEEDK